MSDKDDNLVNVQIDGTWHKVPKGTRMIEAIRMTREDGSPVLAGGRVREDNSN